MKTIRCRFDRRSAKHKINGPAMGPIIGPTGTFAPLPDAAKWVLSAGMLLGRLELFTVMVLFLPSFWRN